MQLASEPVLGCYSFTMGLNIKYIFDLLKYINTTSSVWKIIVQVDFYIWNR